MILEGVVTTVSPSGVVNVKPMGPAVEPEMRRFILRPFRTSQTYQNLLAHGEGVLHVTDDVLLLAQAAIGQISIPPRALPAQKVRGFVLADACRALEFRAVRFDASGQRVRIDCEVVHAQTLRDFFGFNRAKHAVLEAAILATRVQLRPPAEILAEFAKLALLVEKTGGEREHEALALLTRFAESAREARP